ncbi:unnamed protein product [Ceutorhynchus assimilis]|uniref:Cytochrome b561 domain-containing protein n=1 Tax=Ceutorhynchus assimilis TaxID=467358 RepID=A0A9N9MH09_9CUCU|nr:unnamed protein product [Ceutorhynchus assimilis]
MDETSSYSMYYFTTTTIGIISVVLNLLWVVKDLGGFAWSSKTSQFNWHPFLMLFSFVFIYSQSILVYRTGKRHMSKPNLKYLHAFLHVVSFICAVIGLHAAFESNVKGERENLHSLHSWIGIITVIIFAVQLLCGLSAYLFPVLESNAKALFFPHHVFYGTMAFVLAIITTISGVTEMTMLVPNYSTLPSVAYLINIMGITIVMHGVLTLYLLFKPEFGTLPLANN